MVLAIAATLDIGLVESLVFVTGRIGVKIIIFTPRISNEASVAVLWIPFDICFELG